MLRRAARLPACRAFEEGALPWPQASQPLQALLRVLAFEFCSPNPRHKQQRGVRAGRGAGANGATVVPVSCCATRRRQAAGMDLG